MHLWERMIFGPPGGMFREFTGINAFWEPADYRLYEQLLPPQFDMPLQPVVMLFAADYRKVFPWPMTRYQEWAILQKCTWEGAEGWYVLTMPVTAWVAKQGGRHLGFPKYIADRIRLRHRGGGWEAQSRHNGTMTLKSQFRPGITRQLAPWEEELAAIESFFKGDIYVLVPPGEGPRADKVWLEHVVSPSWSSEIGTVRITVNRDQLWAGLLPEEDTLFGTFTHFTGAFNLVSERLWPTEPCPVVQGPECLIRAAGSAGPRQRAFKDSAIAVS
jgi:hypothetical protein